MAARKTNYRIGLLRTRAGVSRDDLAKATGRSAKMIERYENGKVDPPGEVLARMAACLETSVDDLLNLPARLPSELEVNGQRYVRDPTVGPPEAQPASGERDAPFDLPTAIAGSAAAASAGGRGKASPSRPRPKRQRREPPAPEPAG